MRCPNNDLQLPYQTGAAAEAAQFVQNVIRRLLPRDGSPVEDGEERGQSGQES
jgi:hypothetical protein